MFITSATTTTTTITGPKGDHHMPHKHKQQTVMCDWKVREQREDKGKIPCFMYKDNLAVFMY